MQIKFNKIVKPVVPLSEGELSQPAPAEVNQMPQSQGVKMEEFPSVTQPVDVSAPVEEVAEQVPEEIVPAAPTGKMGLKIEDTLRTFLGKQIRIYMSDHEYVAGKLEIVEDGWVKICNARSAGSDYYFDEDIVNTRNIVRVRASVTIDKKQYVDFMNSNNN